MRTKSLHYAYPTSPLADRLNNGEGCWLVDDQSGLPPIVFQTHEKLEAYNHWLAINLPVARDCLTTTKTWSIPNGNQRN